MQDVSYFRTTIEHRQRRCIVVRNYVSRTMHSYRLRVLTSCGDQYEIDENSEADARAHLDEHAVPTCICCVVYEFDGRYRVAGTLGYQPRMRYRL